MKIKRLNDIHRWLPRWPDMWWDAGSREYRVEGKHVTYNGYRLARWILSLSVFLYLYHAFTSRYHWEITKQQFTYQRESVYDRWHWQVPVMIVFSEYMLYFVLVTIFPIPKWICWLFLRRRTRVRFSRDRFFIDKEQFFVQPGVPVRFQAFETPIPQYIINRKHYAVADYLGGFRNIEIIYGDNRMVITSIDSEREAEQFVLVLQRAFQASQSQQASTLLLGEGSPSEEMFDQ